MLPVFTAQIIATWLSSKRSSAKAVLIASVMVVILVKFGIGYVVLKREDDHALALVRYAFNLIKQSADIQECRKRHDAGEFKTFEGAYVLCQKPFAMQIFTEVGIQHQRSLDAISNEFLKVATKSDSGQQTSTSEQDKTAKQLFTIIRNDLSERAHSPAESPRTTKAGYLLSGVDLYDKVFDANYKATNGGVPLFSYLLGLSIITVLFVAWSGRTDWKWVTLPVAAALLITADTLSSKNMLPIFIVLLPIVIGTVANKTHRNVWYWGLGALISSATIGAFLVIVGFTPPLSEDGPARDYYRGLALIIGCGGAAVMLVLSSWWQLRQKRKAMRQ